MLAMSRFELRERQPVQRDDLLVELSILLKAAGLAGKAEPQVSHVLRRVKPAVHTDEVVRDGASGLLTKNDAAALAEAAIRLLLDAPRRLAMGKCARQIAEQDFGVGIQIDRTLALYREALGRRGRSVS